MIARLALLLVALLTITTFTISTPTDARAGVSESLMALAGPLAQQFGVPSSAVQALFDKGLSLETATQLLLVSQSAKKPIDQVSQLYDASSQSVTKTADQLKVASSAYSKDKVQAAIDRAQADAQAKAADEASKAAGSAIGGMLP